MRTDLYGQLQVEKNRAAYDIWRTRHDEPEPCELLELEPEDDPSEIAASRVTAEKLVGLLDGKLTPREMLALVAYHVVGRTYDELGVFMNVTTKRARDIEQRALRKARVVAGQAGIRPNLLDG